MGYVTTPFTVIRDTRENHGWNFTGFKSDARNNYVPLLVCIEDACLPTGDYSIKGMESRVAVERKSREDAYSTFSPTGGRERFERELARLNQMEFAAVVIEASEGDCLTDPPPHTRFSPKSFWRSVTAWEVKFSHVRFYHAATRQMAERKTLRWFQKIYEYEQKRLKEIT